MYEKDILKLADHLAKVPRRGFDMGAWSRVVNGKSIRPQHVKQGFECGMAACLGGHAAVVFPRRLKLKHFSNSCAADLHSRDEKRFGSRAFAQALDLCFKCAQACCASGAPHNTPKRAIRTLQRLVAGKSWETARNGARKSRPYECHFGVADCNG